SADVPVTLGSLPLGAGYVIDLVGVASDGTTTCGGSARFVVSPGSRSTVVVHLVCHPGTTGGAGVTGTFNVCAALDALGASPAEALVGGSLALSAEAHDADSGPGALRYQWSATTGAFSNATIA